MSERPKGLQWIWWCRPRSEWFVGFRRFAPKDTDLAYIYDWALALGPLEVRKWSERNIVGAKEE